MRFVQVIYHYWTGGAEKQALLAARCLVRAGHPCRVFSLAPGDDSPRASEWLERAVRSGVSVAPAPRGSRDYPGNLWSLWRAVRGHDPVALWCWGSRAELLCKAVALTNPRVRLVCSLRSADPAWLHASRRVLRFLPRRVACYVSNSQRALDIAGEILGDRMPPGFILRNALDDPFPEAATIPPPNGVLRVAMLGNIIRHLKGYDDLVRLAVAVRDRSLPVRFSVAGRPDEGEWFRGALKEAQVEHLVDYVGPAADPLGFLRKHHAFLLLSRVEGFPNALLEALSLGLPCISTRVGDLPTIAESGRQLHLVDVSDVRAVLACLERLLSDWPAAAAMGANGRGWCARHFSETALTAGLERLAGRLAAR